MIVREQVLREFAPRRYGVSRDGGGLHAEQASS